MRDRLKKWLFALFDKDPEAVIVCFRSGHDKAGEKLSDAMVEEIRKLEPNRRVIEIRPDEPVRLGRYRIGLAPSMMPIRWAAVLRAPRKILAYNSRLERHHLRLSSPIASWLFLRGVPLDRIFLRPKWFFQRDKTVRPEGHLVTDGRKRVPGRKSIAVLTPYFPYPLSHGGAVRMFNLLRETAREFDVILYAFTEGPVPLRELSPVLAFCSRTYLVQKPRYREPRWSTIVPPEVGEYESPAMEAIWRARETDLAQVEFTYLAPYGGDILVEHDITFDLYAQKHARRKSLSTWWDSWRWHRFEKRAVAQFRRAVVMSEKDRKLLDAGNTYVVENGVDLDRFTPEPERDSRRILFIGSFRHFPNIVAFRFLTEEILPLVPNADCTVVAGPEPWLHWKNHTGTLPPEENPRVKILEFVADVRPLYHEANIVVVPTRESAGTNVKVLEAMAMQRAVVSTTTGCQGFGLEHGVNVWISESVEGLAEGIAKLFNDSNLRYKIAAAGREHVEKKFGWQSIGRHQRELYRELLGQSVIIRAAIPNDLPRIEEIQNASPEASQWPPLDYNCAVAVSDSQVIGFIVYRAISSEEHEVLNVAVDPSSRRKGIARELVEHALQVHPGRWFLEVRESNSNAIALYKSLGFEAVGRREKYYENPVETAIVMRRDS